MEPKNIAKKYRIYIILGVAALIVLFFVSSYNSLIKKEEKVKQQWGEVQNTYQRRLDLIPNLVGVVKGISNFEQSTFTEITEARAKAARLINQDPSTGNIQAQQDAQDSLAAAANRLIVAIEDYPDLKGTKAYSGLQTQLEGTERRIAVARKDFNDAVAVYNKKARAFPTNLAAKLFGFKKAEAFRAESGANRAVTIKFN